MIVTSAEEFRTQIKAGRLKTSVEPVPRGVFVIEPANFQLSQQAAEDNQYMDLEVDVSQNLALLQHRDLTNRIADCGIPVVRFPGSSKNPDDLFPNNVFGTSPGRFIIGAMLHPDRQAEAGREDIRAFFRDLMGYREFDLSQKDLIAELTGALVIDRARNLGFCGITQRVDEAGCQAMHEAFDLDMTFRFALRAEEYHTNVVMSVLASRALIICPDAFADPQVPAAIAEAFSGRVLEISRSEKEAFAGNCIALTETDLFISATGWRALTAQKRRMIEDWGFRVHAVEMHEIEKAGGSLRCCIAEIF